MSSLSFQRRRGFLIASAWTALALLLTPACALPKRVSVVGQWGVKSHRIGRERPSISQLEVVQSLRAGATVEESADEEEDSDDEEEDSDDEEEDYDEDISSSDEEYETAVEEEEISVSVEEYDTQIKLPPGLQMGGLLAVMLLSRRLDMFSPKVVRFAR